MIVGFLFAGGQQQFSFRSIAALSFAPGGNPDSTQRQKHHFKLPGMGVSASKPKVLPLPRAIWCTQCTG